MAPRGLHSTMRRVLSSTHASHAPASTTRARYFAASSRHRLDSTPETPEDKANRRARPFANFNESHDSEFRPTFLHAQQQTEGQRMKEEKGRIASTEESLRRLRTHLSTGCFLRIALRNHYWMSLKLFDELHGQDGGLVNDVEKSRFEEKLSTSSLELEVQTSMEEGLLKELEWKLKELKERDPKAGSPAKPSRKSRLAARRKVAHMSSTVPWKGDGDSHAQTADDLSLPQKDQPNTLGCSDMIKSFGRPRYV